MMEDQRADQRADDRYRVRIAAWVGPNPVIIDELAELADLEMTNSSDVELAPFDIVELKHEESERFERQERRERNALANAGARASGNRGRVKGHARMKNRRGR